MIKYKFTYYSLITNTIEIKKYLILFNCDDCGEFISAFKNIRYIFFKSKGSRKNLIIIK